MGGEPKAALTSLEVDLLCVAWRPLLSRLSQSLVRDSAAFSAASLRSALASAVIGGGCLRGAREGGAGVTFELSGCARFGESSLVLGWPHQTALPTNRSADL